MIDKDLEEVLNKCAVLVAKMLSQYIVKCRQLPTALYIGKHPRWYNSLLLTNADGVFSSSFIIQCLHTNSLGMSVDPIYGLSPDAFDDFINVRQKCIPEFFSSQRCCIPMSSLKPKTVAELTNLFFAHGNKLMLQKSRWTLPSDSESYASSNSLQETCQSFGIDPYSLAMSATLSGDC